MAQTTTAVNACDVNINLDDSGGTLRDISGSTNSVSIDFDATIGDYSTFDSEWKGRLQCGKDASMSIEAIYTTTANEALDLLKDWFFNNTGTARTIQVDIPDSSSGSDRYSGEWLMEAFSFSLGADEASPIAISADFLPTGEVTVATI